MRARAICALRRALFSNFFVDGLPHLVGYRSGEVSNMLKSRGALTNGVSATTMRAVTYYDVTRADCELAIEVLLGVLAKACLAPQA